MKRISVSILLVLISVFILSACGFFRQTGVPVSVTLESNIEGPNLRISPPDEIFTGREVTITAGTYPGYIFVEWQYEDGTFFSTFPSTRFVIEGSVTFVAIYEVFDDPGFYLNLQANIEGVDFSLSQAGPYYEKDTTLTITAPDIEGYTFNFFEDANQNVMISRDQTITIHMDDSRHIMAYYAPEGEYHVSIETNIKTFSAQALDPGPYELGDEIELLAPYVEGYDFYHWYDYFNDQVLSTEKQFTYTVTGTQRLIAIYVEVGDPMLYYTTGFEDVMKVSFAKGTIETNGYEWLLDDALIGTSSADQKNGFRSVRLRAGSLSTTFGIQYLSRIEMQVGTFGLDPVSELTLEVSQDNEHWHALDTFTVSATFHTYLYHFDSDELYELGLTTAEPLFIRVQSDGDESTRVNIDDLRIFTEDSSIPPIDDDVE